MKAAAPQPAPYGNDDGYASRPLTPEQRDGRETWYFWTGGNETFWVEMARRTDGNVNRLDYATAVATVAGSAIWAR